ncbi:hypothetical protein [Lacrimispora sp.]
MPIPNLDFCGTATAIDMGKVLETGILAIINTAMAHKIGIYQILNTVA